MASISYNLIEKEKYKKLIEEIDNTNTAMISGAKIIYVENPRKSNLGNCLCWSGSIYGFYSLQLQKISNSFDIKNLLKIRIFVRLTKDATRSLDRIIDLTKIAIYYSLKKCHLICMSFFTANYKC